MALKINELTGQVIGAAIEVHKALGPGLLESVYETCLCMDVLVADCLIVELKACDALQPVHEAQLLTYLKLTGLKVGLLINFNVPTLKEGIRRLAN